MTAGVRVGLIVWETKIVPLESLAILRLELLGYDLINKLISEMCSAVSSNLLIDNRLCWTDHGNTSLDRFRSRIMLDYRKGRGL